MAEMKPVELQPEKVKALWKLFQEAFPHMTDAERNILTYRGMLLDQYTQMFEGPGGIVYILRDLYLADGNASLTMLVPQKFALRRVEEIRASLQWVMELFDLTRIFATSFSPSMHRLLERIGFTREGVLRKAGIVDSERTDLHVYSILIEDFNPSEADAAEALIQQAGLAS